MFLTFSPSATTDLQDKTGRHVMETFVGSVVVDLLLLLLFVGAFCLSKYCYSVLCAILVLQLSWGRELAALL